MTTILHRIKAYLYDNALTKDNHSILFQFNQGESLRKELPSIEVEILGVADSGIFISHVTDVKSGSVNDLLTPNRNLKITGQKLKIAGDSNANGIYFINQVTNERIRVDDSDVALNNPSELLIIIPALDPGTYKLEIATQFSSANTFLKEPRITLFERDLLVE